MEPAPIPERDSAVWWWVVVPNRAPMTTTTEISVCSQAHVRELGQGSHAGNAADVRESRQLNHVIIGSSYQP